MSSTDPHSQLVLGLKKLAGDITAASASDANGMDGTFVASSITVLLEKFDQEEKSVVDSNVSVAEQLASLLATVSAPGAAQVSAPDAACVKRDRGVIKQNLGAVPFLKRDVVLGSTVLHRNLPVLRAVCRQAVGGSFGGLPDSHP